MPKAVKTLVREMLQLADRITAVHVAVAALPQHTGHTNTTAANADSAQCGNSNGDSSSNSNSGCVSAAQPEPAVMALGFEPASSLSQQPDAQLSTMAAAEEQSVQYVITVLTQPLHESHQRLLKLVADVAAAVKQQLLQPSAAALQQLQQLVHLLEEERLLSVGLFARVRKQLHHDVMQRGDPPADDSWSDHLHVADQGPQQHLQQLDPMDGPPAGAVSQQQLSVAVASDGILPGPASTASTDSSVDLAMHVSRWWWMHAGEHYCQLLAFQYAFDAVVAEVSAVANTAMSL